MADSVQKTVSRKERGACLARGYRLSDTFLGGGAVGRVFLAEATNDVVSTNSKLQMVVRQKPSDQSLKVAIKIIYADVGTLSLKKLAKYIPTEVANLNKVFGHSNIIMLLDVFVSCKRVFLVTELAARGSIKSLCRAKLRIDVNDRSMSEPEARYYFGGIIDGLSSLHDQNIAHRDLKLDNVLICEFGQIKLADFGFSVQLPVFDPFEENTVEVARDIMKSTMCGTPAYMAPEVLRGFGGYDAIRADLWSLGVILYILTNGQYPFHGQTTEDVLIQIERTGKDGLKFEKEISCECKDLIHKLLCSHPLDRISIFAVLQHPWMNINNPVKTPEFANVEPISWLEEEIAAIKQDPVYDAQEKFVRSYLLQRSELLSTSLAELNERKMLPSRIIREFGFPVALPRRENIADPLLFEVWRLKSICHCTNVVQGQELDVNLVLDPAYGTSLRCDWNDDEQGSTIGVTRIRRVLLKSSMLDYWCQLRDKNAPPLTDLQKCVQLYNTVDLDLNKSWPLGYPIPKPTSEWVKLKKPKTPNPFYHLYQIREVDGIKMTLRRITHPVPDVSAILSRYTPTSEYNKTLDDCYFQHTMDSADNSMTLDMESESGSMTSYLSPDDSVEASVEAHVTQPALQKLSLPDQSSRKSFVEMIKQEAGKTCEATQLASAFLRPRDPSSSNESLTSSSVSAESRFSCKSRTQNVEERKLEIRALPSSQLPITAGASVNLKGKCIARKFRQRPNLGPTKIPFPSGAMWRIEASAFAKVASCGEPKGTTGRCSSMSDGDNYFVETLSEKLSDSDEKENLPFGNIRKIKFKPAFGLLASNVNDEDDLHSSASCDSPKSSSKRKRKGASLFRWMSKLMSPKRKLKGTQKHQLPKKTLRDADNVINTRLKLDTKIAAEPIVLKQDQCSSGDASERSATTSSSGPSDKSYTSTQASCVSASNSPILSQRSSEAFVLSPRSTSLIPKHGLMTYEKENVSGGIPGNSLGPGGRQEISSRSFATLNCLDGFDSESNSDLASLHTPTSDEIRAMITEAENVRKGIFDDSSDEIEQAVDTASQKPFLSKQKREKSTNNKRSERVSSSDNILHSKDAIKPLKDNVKVCNVVERAIVRHSNQTEERDRFKDSRASFDSPRLHVHKQNEMQTVITEAQTVKKKTFIDILNGKVDDSTRHKNKKSLMSVVKSQEAKQNDSAGTHTLSRKNKDALNQTLSTCSSEPTDESISWMTFINQQINENAHPDQTFFGPKPRGFTTEMLVDEPICLLYHDEADPQLLAELSSSASNSGFFGKTTPRNDATIPDLVEQLSNEEGGFNRTDTSRDVTVMGFGDEKPTTPQNNIILLKRWLDRSKSEISSARADQKREAGLKQEQKTVFRGQKSSSGSFKFNAKEVSATAAAQNSLVKSEMNLASVRSYLQGDKVNENESTEEKNREYPALSSWLDFSDTSTFAGSMNDEKRKKIHEKYGYSDDSIAFICSNKIPDNAYMVQLSSRDNSRRISENYISDAVIDFTAFNNSSREISWEGNVSLMEKKENKQTKLKHKQQSISWDSGSKHPARGRITDAVENKDEHTIGVIKATGSSDGTHKKHRNPVKTPNHHTLEKKLRATAEVDEAMTDVQSGSSSPGKASPIFGKTSTGGRNHFLNFREEMKSDLHTLNGEKSYYLLKKLENEELKETEFTRSHDNDGKNEFHRVDFQRGNPQRVDVIQYDEMHPYDCPFVRPKRPDFVPKLNLPQSSNESDSLSPRSKDKCARKENLNFCGIINKKYLCATLRCSDDNKTAEEEKRMKVASHFRQENETKKKHTHQYSEAREKKKQSQGYTRGTEGCSQSNLQQLQHASENSFLKPRIDAANVNSKQNHQVFNENEPDYSFGDGALVSSSKHMSSAMKVSAQIDENKCLPEKHVNKSNHRHRQGLKPSNLLKIKKENLRGFADSDSSSECSSAVPRKRPKRRRKRGGKVKSTVEEKRQTQSNELHQELILGHCFVEESVQETLQKDESDQTCCSDKKKDYEQHKMRIKRRLPPIPIATASHSGNPQKEANNVRIVLSPKTVLSGYHLPALSNRVKEFKKYVDKTTEKTNAKIPDTKYPKEDNDQAAAHAFAQPRYRFGEKRIDHYQAVEVKKCEPKVTVASGTKESLKQKGKRADENELEILEYLIELFQRLKKRRESFHRQNVEGKGDSKIEQCTLLLEELLKSATLLAKEHKDTRSVQTQTEEFASVGRPAMQADFLQKTYSSNDEKKPDKKDNTYHFEKHEQEHLHKFPGVKLHHKVTVPSQLFESSRPIFINKKKMEDDSKSSNSNIARHHNSKTILQAKVFMEHDETVNNQMRMTTMSSPRRKTTTRLRKLFPRKTTIVSKTNKLFPRKTISSNKSKTTVKDEKDKSPADSSTNLIWLGEHVTRHLSEIATATDMILKTLDRVENISSTSGKESDKGKTYLPPLDRSPSSIFKKGGCSSSCSAKSVEAVGNESWCIDTSEKKTFGSCSTCTVETKPVYSSHNTSLWLDESDPYDSVFSVSRSHPNDKPEEEKYLKSNKDKESNLKCRGIFTRERFTKAVHFLRRIKGVKNCFRSKNRRSNPAGKKEVTSSSEDLTINAQPKSIVKRSYKCEACENSSH